MKQGERQVERHLDKIRRDHVARYEFAAKIISPSSAIVDFACGVGYGSNILAQAGHQVVGVDKDAEALEYAAEHWKHELIQFVQWDAEQIRPDQISGYDAAVCFETVEHLRDPVPLLTALRASSDTLLVSVPNEDVMPWQIDKNTVTAFHYRHYTPAQFEALLNATGWEVAEWYGQSGPESEVEKDVMGRTLIAVCKHRAPQHISIVGLGPSSAQYVRICQALGGRSKFCDETWTINALGDVLASDRIFHMDDVRIQQIRADARPESNIAAMLDWLKTTDVPVITSRAHPDYPGMVEFPLEAVINDCPFGYFNSTAAYAVAYAIYLGVKKITLFGCDFTYPNAHDAEKGRACVEFWLGMAAERGIEIAVPKTTSLLDAMHSQAARFYGYDCVDLDIQRAEGRVKIGFTERVELPTAEAIEASYDHSIHPNALVKNEESKNEGR